MRPRGLASTTTSWRIAFTDWRITWSRRRSTFVYVVTLLLIRRKRFKLEETIETAPGGLAARDVAMARRYEVTNPRLDEDAMSEVQGEVFKVLEELNPSANHGLHG